MTTNEFRFYTSLGLVELTGQKARNVSELVEIIKQVDDSSIFYHTHRYLREYHFLKEECSSDFGQWAFDSVQEMALGEKLANIDILNFTDIKSLREAITAVLEDYILSGVRIWNVPSGKELHFCRLVSVIMPTKYVATDLGEFSHALKNISINSLYFHLFEARLRLGRKTNDFSHWIEDALGNPPLARSIEALDPYNHTLNELRTKIIDLIERHTGTQR